MAAGGVGGQCRCVCGSHRIREVSAWQLASCNSVAYSLGSRRRGIRPCGRGELSRAVGRLKLSALARLRARGVAGTDGSPGVRSRASCSSRTSPNTTQRLVQYHRSVWPDKRMQRRPRSESLIVLSLPHVAPLMRGVRRSVA